MKTETLKVVSRNISQPTESQVFYCIDAPEDNINSVILSFGNRLWFLFALYLPDTLDALPFHAAVQVIGCSSEASET